MSFGGAVSAMVTSLKNNKRERVSALKKLEKYDFKEKGELYFKNNATENKLKKIRENTKKEANREMLSKAIPLIIFCLAILLAIGFVKF